MEFKREYLLRADLKEEIYEWINNADVIDVSIFSIEQLAERIFYRLLHAGDLRERRPVSFSPKKWLIDITGLSDKEIEEKISKTMGDIKKLKERKTIHFKVKGLKMKVDADSPFKGETI